MRRKYRFHLRFTIYYLPFYCLISLAWCAGARAQDISNYMPGEGEGIAFFLPKTALEVNVIATKVVREPGEFCQYANRYLRLNNVSGERETYWEIKDVDVRSIGVPDSTKAYIVKLKDRDVLSKVTLTSEGILWAINATPTPIAAASYDLEKPSVHENPRNYMTEEILAAGSTAKMAELTAKDIYNIRESKNLILRGQAETLPKDGESLKLILANLEKQEKAMLEMFTGTEDRTDKVFTFLVSPSDNLTDAIAARFSTHLGVVPVDDLSGSPIYVSVTSSTPLPALSGENGRARRVSGVMFNVPGKGKVKVSYKGETLFEKELPITQFGNSEILSTSLFNQKNNTSVIFNPQTGSVVKID